MAVGQNPAPLVNINIGGTWGAHPLQNGAIGYDPWLCLLGPITVNQGKLELKKQVQCWKSEACLAQVMLKRIGEWGTPRVQDRG